MSDKDSKSEGKQALHTFKDPRGPSRLHLRDGHDGAQRLHETDNSQRVAVQLRRKHILVKRRLVLSHRDHLRRQERKGKLVTSGKHL